MKTIEINNRLVCYDEYNLDQRKELKEFLE